MFCNQLSKIFVSHTQVQSELSSDLHIILEITREVVMFHGSVCDIRITYAVGTANIVGRSGYGSGDRRKQHLGQSCVTSRSCGHFGVEAGEFPTSPPIGRLKNGESQPLPLESRLEGFASHRSGHVVRNLRVGA